MSTRLLPETTSPFSLHNLAFYIHLILPPESRTLYVKELGSYLLK